MKKLIFTVTEWANLQNAKPLYGTQQNDINSAIELAETVQPFHPCEAMIYASENNGQMCFEFASAKLEHPKFDLFVGKRYRPAGFVIGCREYLQFKNLTSNDRHRVMNTLVKRPNDIGVLTTKKIASWVAYHETCLQTMADHDQQNANFKNKFLAQLEETGLPVVWNGQKNAGYISRNGLTYRFEIGESAISTRVVLDSQWHDIAGFMAISDNKLNG